MTTENKPKQKPAYYIFHQGADGKRTRIGAAFQRKNGKGLNVVIDTKWYTVFAPKEKTVEGGGA